MPPKTLPKKSPHFVAPPPPSSSDRSLFDYPPSISSSSPSHSVASSFASPQKPVSPIQRSSVFDTPVSPDHDSLPRRSQSSNHTHVQQSVTSSLNQPPARYRPITGDDLSSLRKTPPSPKITRPSYMPLSSSPTSPPASHTSIASPPRMKPLNASISSSGVEHSTVSNGKPPSPICSSFSAAPLRNSPTNNSHQRAINNPRRQTVILNTAPRHSPSPQINSPQRQTTSINCVQNQNSPMKSPQNQNSLLNSPQRQISSPYSTNNTPSLQRQNSNPSQQPHLNQNSILLNNTQSLPRPNSAMARRNLASPCSNPSRSPGI